VPAGHDQFPLGLVGDVLGERHARVLEAFNCCLDDTLNMTYLALRISHYINGVSMRHEEIAHTMFPNYPLNAITNGVHAATWTSVQQAHCDAKRELLEEIE
jgi:starch phosphorylase